MTKKLHILTSQYSAAYHFSRKVEALFIDKENKDAAIELKISDVTGNRNNLRSDIIKDNHTLSPVSYGLYICEPAFQLYCLYRNEIDKEKTDVSFIEFCRISKNRNVTTRSIETKLSKYDFIGVDERFIQSALLYEKWTNSTISRLVYSESFEKKRLSEISENTLREVYELNRDDYLFYESIQEEFISRWRNLLSESALEIPRGKNITIHLGPPKTGTSAIQYWLNNHLDFLEQNSICYPPHQIDSNKISSGNFEYLITNSNRNKRLFFDEEKAKQLIQKFVNSDAKLLLLSSEHFFYHLPKVFKYFPHANYIFYIRHPLDILESSYHQQVKRHKRSSKINIPEKVKFLELDIVRRLLDIYNIKVSFRFYEPKLFIGGTLISDFCSSINIDLPEKMINKIINRRYTLSALEFMRLCNTFASDANLIQLDYILQKYSEDHESDSILTFEQAHELNNSAFNHAEVLASSLSNLSIEDLKVLIRSYKVKSSNPITIESRELKSLIKKIKRNNPTLFLNLRNELNLSSSDSKQELSPMLKLNFFELSNIFISKCRRFLVKKLRAVL